MASRSLVYDRPVWLLCFRYLLGRVPSASYGREISSCAARGDLPVLRLLRPYMARMIAAGACAYAVCSCCCWVSCLLWDVWDAGRLMRKQELLWGCYSHSSCLCS